MPTPAGPLVSRVAEYRERLRPLPPAEWEGVLLLESRLPGPRANLELAHAVADLAGEPAVIDHLLHWAAVDVDTAPADTPGEFLAFCGVLGIGEVAARAAAGEDAAGSDPAPWVGRLRRHAGDPRWRVQEAVAQALQRVGYRDLALLRETADEWAGGSWLERRAAMAGVCEPGLLTDPDHAAWAVTLLDRITRAFVGADDSSENARTLRKALGYGWSVAIVASPAAGRTAFEAWAAHPHTDARWIVRQNLKKQRFQRLDAAWASTLSG